MDIDTHLKKRLHEDKGQDGGGAAPNQGWL